MQTNKWEQQISQLNEAFQSQHRADGWLLAQR